MVHHRKALDYVFIAYFALHVPITLLLDAQCVLPRAWYPAPLQELMDWYPRVMKDELAVTSGAPLWFRSIVWLEVLLQLPFFVVATFGWIQEKKWLRDLVLVYCGHVLTTLVPILAVFLWGDGNGRTPMETAQLIAVYSPWVILPLMLLARALGHTELFPAAKRHKD